MDSPIFFKIIENYVFICAERIPDEIYGKKFVFSGNVKHPRDPRKRSNYLAIEEGREKRKSLMVPTKRELEAVGFTIDELLEKYVGYYNDNKEMCFSSRKDFQIKHNGHRIELGELDMAINSMDNIQRACCIYQQEENKIYAFYEGEQDNKSLTHYLLSKLPKFMIPEVMINVKSMPLTKNGKIDRKALMEEYNA